MSNINSLYPASCNGAASCALRGRNADLLHKPVRIPFTRIALFGTSGSGEIIASPTDPNSAFYLWLCENSSSPTCAFSTPNGHRWLILKSTGAVGWCVRGQRWQLLVAALRQPRFLLPSLPTAVGFGPGMDHLVRRRSPQRCARVNVNGMHRHDLARGTPTNAAYTATLTNVASGCHRYYFEFKDSANNAVTYPTTGSLGIGPGGHMPRLGCRTSHVVRRAACVCILSVTKAGTGAARWPPTRRASIAAPHAAPLQHRHDGHPSPFRPR